MKTQTTPTPIQRFREKFTEKKPAVLGNTRYNYLAVKPVESVEIERFLIQELQASRKEVIETLRHRTHNYLEKLIWDESDIEHFDRRIFEVALGTEPHVNKIEKNEHEEDVMLPAEEQEEDKE